MANNTGGTITLASGTPGATFQVAMTFSGQATIGFNNRGTVAASAFLNVTNFHDAADLIPLPIGISYFRVNAGLQQSQVRLKSDGSNGASIDYWLAVK